MNAQCPPEDADVRQTGVNGAACHAHGNLLFAAAPPPAAQRMHAVLVQTTVVAAWDGTHDCKDGYHHRFHLQNHGVPSVIVAGPSMHLG